MPYYFTTYFIHIMTYYENTFMPVSTHTVYLIFKIFYCENFQNYLSRENSIMNQNCNPRFNTANSDSSIPPAILPSLEYFEANTRHHIIHL